ncbi:hypothetical protein LCGC14_0579760 [marine sediment metagenome]|uniref:Uncharacterized protein n=1 Tax=marine sediment metagenome TaxID=412755 RepID=A0A0F9RLQ4_9ZZZZ
MKIRWLVDVGLTIYEEEDNPDGEFVTVKAGEEDEIDIVSEKNGFVDIQFGVGSMAYNVRTTWYEEI